MSVDSLDFSGVSVMLAAGFMTRLFHGLICKVLNIYILQQHNTLTTAETSKKTRLCHRAGQLGLKRRKHGFLWGFMTRLCHGLRGPSVRSYILRKISILEQHSTLTTAETSKKARLCLWTVWVKTEETLIIFCSWVMLAASCWQRHRLRGLPVRSYIYIFRAA